MGYIRASGGGLIRLPGGTCAMTAGTTVPVYASSAIEESTPTKLEMTYNASLANVVPATSAFTVMVNGVAATVDSVSISGTKVILTLADAVLYSNTITVEYTKPISNPIQTSSGGEAVSLATSTVTNNRTGDGTVSVDVDYLQYYVNGNPYTVGYVTVTSSGAWTSQVTQDDYSAVQSVTASGNSGDKCYIAMKVNITAFYPSVLITISTEDAYTNVRVYQDSI